MIVVDYAANRVSELSMQAICCLGLADSLIIEEHQVPLEGVFKLQVLLGVQDRTSQVIHYLP